MIQHGKMHPVVHFNIPVTDPAKSRAWFEKLFGWNIQEIPGMNYWMVYTTDTDTKTQTAKKPGAINGGMGRRADAGVSQPYFTIDVDDIDVALKEIEAAGGTVTLPKTTMGEWGATARFTDPDGNVFGLFEGPKR
jgi:predicted enzyme related to lactoylglutathione lyase